jgi:hypothetical protein
MNPKQLFSFQDLASGDKASKAVEKAFAKASAATVTSSVDSKITKSSGIASRQMLITMADGQTVTLRIKETGDIFQVLLNGKLTPIKNQDDHAKAVSEIVGLLTKNRSKFQASLAKVNIPMPKGMKTAAPTMIVQLTARRDELKTQIQAVNDEILAIAV